MRTEWSSNSLENLSRLSVSEQLCYPFPSSDIEWLKEKTKQFFLPFRKSSRWQMKNLFVFFFLLPSSDQSLAKFSRFNLFNIGWLCGEWMWSKMCWHLSRNVGFVNDASHCVMCSSICCTSCGGTELQLNWKAKEKVGMLHPQCPVKLVCHSLQIASIRCAAERIGRLFRMTLCPVYIHGSVLWPISFAGCLCFDNCRIFWRFRFHPIHEWKEKILFLSSSDSVLWFVVWSILCARQF